MTDGGIGPAKGDFDHEDVERQTDSFVCETPAAKLLVRSAGFNGNKGLRYSEGVIEEGNAFEFGVGINVGFWGGKKGGLPEGNEHEENLIVARVKITGKRVNINRRFTPRIYIRPSVAVTSKPNCLPLVFCPLD